MRTETASRTGLLTAMTSAHCLPRAPVAQLQKVWMQPFLMIQSAKWAVEVLAQLPPARIPANSLIDGVVRRLVEAQGKGGG